MKKSAWIVSSCAVAALAGYLALQPFAPTVRAQTQGSPDPQYVPGNGNLIRPKDFHGWMFVGSNLGLSYATELKVNTGRERLLTTGLGEYHNIYLKPEAYSDYVRTGTFPDRTVLVMDVYQAMARDAKGVVTAGSYNGDWLGIEVAVKNNHRPDHVETDWAYYDFTDRVGHGKNIPADQKAELKKDCYDCHRAHAGYDNVWVQFYPIIRGVKHPG
jgi:hypothetical protein